MSRSRNNNHLLAARAFGKDWIKDDYWKDTQGGFNPEVFADLDPVTRQRLSDYRIGPRVLKGDEESRGGFTDFRTNTWSDTKPDRSNFHMGFMHGILDPDSEIAKRTTNRGNVQNAVWEAGFANIGNKDQLNQFLDRADAVKANNPDFLKDGWTPEAQMLMREYPIQEVIQESVPVVADPIEVAETPAVVEQAPAVREPVKGVDYMSSEMQDIYDRIQDQDYHTGFNAEDWIAKTSRPDIDKQQLAQKLADTYKFKINKQLKEEEIADKVSTAVGNSLGVYPGYSV